MLWGGGEGLLLTIKYNPTNGTGQTNQGPECEANPSLRQPVFYLEVEEFRVNISALTVNKYKLNA